MPSRAPRQCGEYGCGKPVTDGARCAEHQQQRQRGIVRKRIDPPALRYNSSRWVAARKIHLMNHPLCVECRMEGRVEAAGIVDHIIPHRGDAVLFWDESNWQSLCVTHHGIKTMRESVAPLQRRGNG